MAIPFTKIKNRFGLDDVMPFGRHLGYTVLEIIKDRPIYISWLIQNTNLKFHESVHEQLKLAKPKHVPRGPCGPWIYAGDLLGEQAHYAMEQWSADNDELEDVPF